jgi:hypothetical protein
MPTDIVPPVFEDATGLTKHANERQTAKVYAAQLDGECKAWDEATQRRFIQKSFEFWESCTDNRARAALQVSLGNWLRLGKREPASQTAAKQAGNNIQININVIQPATRQEVMDRTPEV